MEFQDDILNTKLSAARQFIESNLKGDPARLRLACAGKELEFDADFAITQIECRRKTAKKLFPFVRNRDFIFPSVTASEQASCWQAARFHTSLIKANDKVLDMTAGLGIDAMTIAGKAASVTACELDPIKVSALFHNASISGLDNVRVLQTDSREFLSETDENFDTIFIDPARRGDCNSRKYAFADCTPDVTVLIPEMLKKASCVLIKASPLLDVTQVLRELPDAKRIFSVSVGGECKELLIEIVKSGKSEESGQEPFGTAVIIDSDGKVTSFLETPLNGLSGFPEPAEASVEDFVSGNFIYQPDAAVMKFSPWKYLQHIYPDIRKASVSTHIFVSSEIIPDFPGRIFRITDCLDKKSMAGLKGKQINVISRNHPLAPDVIKKKYGIRDGGDTYLIAFRTGNKPMAVIACKA